MFVLTKKKKINMSFVYLKIVKIQEPWDALPSQFYEEDCISNDVGMCWWGLSLLNLLIRKDKNKRGRGHTPAKRHDVVEALIERIKFIT